MNKKVRWIAITAVVVILIGAGVAAWVYGVHGPGGGTNAWAGGRPTGEEQERLRALTSDRLAAFGSARALDEYVEEIQALRQAADERSRAEYSEDQAESVSMSLEAPAPEPAAAESITNVQEAGVDEGGIVKAHGDFLIVLRRGRLFSVRLGDAGMTPVSMIDAPPPGSRGGYYDEMLIHDGTIVVVGYNYNEAGTELGIFRIDERGVISRRGTYYLRSGDYYSSRNYASRLLGDRLFFYMPYPFLEEDYDEDDLQLTSVMPGVRPAGRDDWNEIITGARVYQPVQLAMYPVMHTIVQCDLSRPSLSCTAAGIIGPAGHNFYVSRSAVYVWVSEEWWTREEGDESPVGSVVYRLPLDGSAPGALRTWGAPVDQLSFKEGSDAHLNVLVRSEGRGEGMWSAEVEGGDVALLRVPLSIFGDGLAAAQRSQYRALPRPPGYGHAFQNRFVGDHVLYGLGTGWGSPRSVGSGVIAYAYAEGREPARIALPHGVDRIEVLGERAMVIGSGEGGLHFSTVELDADPSVIGGYVQEGASQGETRSHGFFYRATGEDQGALGLPVRGGREPGWTQLVEGSAGVIFLRVEGGALRRLGLLRASGERTEDRCVASCADWYGNARPIFYRGRVFALLGYELVEGGLTDADIRELGRVNFFDAMPR